jgi:tRNA modification GTPase
LAQLDGGLSRRVTALRDAVLQVEALLAYDIDFPEEDDGPVAPSRIEAAALAARSAIDRLGAGWRIGELVREGALVVIAGAPNVGKSSLFNALIGRARALVTDVPGTTRDAIEAVIEPTDAAWPYPLRVVDTAGLRTTSDVVERLGIEVSERYLEGAHVVLACGETPAAVLDVVRRIQPITSGHVVPVLTKSDLHAQAEHAEADADMVVVSAETGDGLPALLAAIYRAVDVRPLEDPDMPVVLRQRHLRSLGAASEEMQLFERALASDVPATVAAVHLRAAVGALDALIGVVRTDDILDRVFASFCIGK